MTARASASEPGVVNLSTHDLTWPRAHMVFKDTETAREVAGLFAPGLTVRANKRAA